MPKGTTRGEQSNESEEELHSLTEPEELDEQTDGELEEIKKDPYEEENYKDAGGNPLKKASFFELMKIKIDRRFPAKDRWVGDKKHGTKFRYPKDLDRFEGDPAGQGGAYINPTHLRLPHTGHEEREHSTTGEGTCRHCQGRTYQPIESRLSPGDPPHSKCVDCGHREDYPLPKFTSYKVQRDGDKVTFTNSKTGKPMSAKEQDRLGFNKDVKERGKSVWKSWLEKKLDEDYGDRGDSDEIPKKKKKKKILYEYVHSWKSWLDTRKDAMTGVSGTGKLPKAGSRTYYDSQGKQRPPPKKTTVTSEQEKPSTYHSRRSDVGYGTEKPTKQTGVEGSRHQSEAQIESGRVGEDKLLNPNNPGDTRHGTGRPEGGYNWEKRTGSLPSDTSDANFSSRDIPKDHDDDKRKTPGGEGTAPIKEGFFAGMKRRLGLGRGGKTTTGGKAPEGTQSGQGPDVKAEPDPHRAQTTTGAPKIHTGTPKPEPKPREEEIEEESDRLEHPLGKAWKSWLEKKKSQSMAYATPPPEKPPKMDADPYDEDDNDDKPKKKKPKKRNGNEKKGNPRPPLKERIAEEEKEKEEDKRPKRIPRWGYMWKSWLKEKKDFDQEEKDNEGKKKIQAEDKEKYKLREFTDWEKKYAPWRLKPPYLDSDYVGGKIPPTPTDRLQNVLLDTMAEDKENENPPKGVKPPTKKHTYKPKDASWKSWLKEKDSVSGKQSKDGKPKEGIPFNKPQGGQSSSKLAESARLYDEKRPSIGSVRPRKNRPKLEDAGAKGRDKYREFTAGGKQTGAIVNTGLGGGKFDGGPKSNPKTLNRGGKRKPRIGAMGAKTTHGKYKSWKSWLEKKDKKQTKIDEKKDWWDHSKVGDPDNWVPPKKHYDKHGKRIKEPGQGDANIEI